MKSKKFEASFQLALAKVSLPKVVKVEGGWEVTDRHGQEFFVKTPRVKKAHAIIIMTYPKFEPSTLGGIPVSGEPGGREVGIVRQGENLVRVIEAAIRHGAFDIEIASNLP